MQRIASVIMLRPEHAQEYERLHEAVWPAVVARLRLSGMTNYSIYRWGDALFSYLEYTGDDLEADRAALALDATTRKWWAICDPMQVPVADRSEGEWWHEIPEVFHLE